MQQQHPPGRQVGNRIYYGNYHGREVQCKKCLLVLFTVLCLLIGFILTIVGHTIKPFWPDTSYCSFCEEDNRATLRNAANCRIAGPIFITFGLLLMIFTIVYFKKKKSEGTTTSGNSYGTTPASTTLTYNQASPSVNVPYPGTGQTQPSCPQLPYPSTQSQHLASQPYPVGTQPYPTGPQPPYPGTTQPYPTAPQQNQPSQSGVPYQPTPYPPTQQPYPGTTQNNDNFAPPPSYSDAVAGNEGVGDTKQ